MKRVIIAILASCIPATGNAECYRFYRHCYPVHRPVAVAVEKKVIVADVVPVLAYSPPVYSVGAYGGYGAGYNDVGTQTQIRLVQLELELARFRAGQVGGQLPAVANQPHTQPQQPQVSSPAAAPGSGAFQQPAAPQPNASTGISILQAKCAVCHEAAVAVNKGAGFIMFQSGQFVGGQKRFDILGRMSAGDMPRKDGAPTQPGEPLTQRELEEAGAFLLKK